MVGVIGSSPTAVETVLWAGGDGLQASRLIGGRHWTAWLQAFLALAMHRCIRPTSNYWTLALTRFDPPSLNRTDPVTGEILVTDEVVVRGLKLPLGASPLTA